MGKRRGVGALAVASGSDRHAWRATEVGEAARGGGRGRRPPPGLAGAPRSEGGGTAAAHPDLTSPRESVRRWVCEEPHACEDTFRLYVWCGGVRTP